MKTLRLVGMLCCVFGSVRAADDIFDQIEQSLSWSSADGVGRARLSGMVDVEGYRLPRSAPGVIDADGRWLLNPRLALFLDAQFGRHVYLFAQARVDRGFDPSDEPAEVRLDEYALRWTPGDGRFSVQVGKFATVVGSWAPRHDSWTNPFITAPLPYENLTGVWDNEPPRSATQLLVWSHVRPGLLPAIAQTEKYLRLPIVWGPSYATGIAIAGQAEHFRYAFELKNASLSSRPDAWALREGEWSHPTVSGRVRFVPNQQWEVGWSASTGSFLRPLAERLIPAPYGRRDYRQVVFGQDISYAWHHLQVWGELYLVRFELPLAGDAKTAAYYVETKYKFTPRFAGAVRWNQQLYGKILERGTWVRWGRQVWRLDLAPAFRLSPHAQVKAQFSLQRGDTDGNELERLYALQFTVRF